MWVMGRIGKDNQEQNNMADEIDKPRKKAISPRSGAELPVPGPGRPKGSKDGPKSKRAQRARVTKMLSCLDQMAKLQGGDMATWLRDLCKRDPAFERWLAETYVRSNMPDAMDPDVKEVALAQSQAAGQEGNKGNATVNLIMGHLGEYAQGITAPAEPVQIGPAEGLDAEVLPPGEPEPQSEPEGEEPENGTWES